MGLLLNMISLELNLISLLIPLSSPLLLYLLLYKMEKDFLSNIMKLFKTWDQKILCQVRITWLFTMLPEEELRKLSSNLSKSFHLTPISFELFPDYFSKFTALLEMPLNSSRDKHLSISKNHHSPTPIQLFEELISFNQSVMSFQVSFFNFTQK